MPNKKANYSISEAELDAALDRLAAEIEAAEHAAAQKLGRDFLTLEPKPAECLFHDALAELDAEMSADDAAELADKVDAEYQAAKKTEAGQ